MFKLNGDGISDFGKGFGAYVVRVKHFIILLARLLGVAAKRFILSISKPSLSLVKGTNF